MSVRTKLALSYLAIVIIFVSLGAYVTYSERFLASRMAALDERFEMTAEQGEVLDATARLALAFQTSHLALHELLLGEMEAQEEFLASMEVFDTHLDELVAVYEVNAARARVASDPEAVEIAGKLVTLEAIEEQHQQFHEDATLVIDLIDAGNLEQASALLEDEEMEGQLAALQQQLAVLEEDAQQQLERANARFDNAVHEMEAMIARLRNLTIALLILSVLGAIGLSRWMSQLITRPVSDLSKTAESVEKGTFELNRLTPLTERRDEFGLLARVFQRMAEEVHAREQALKQQVHQLQIKIDRVKQEQEVAEITETDFFQELGAKAAKLREQRGGSDT
ncbi:MAG: HAMP domain-containing protein [Chloroflexota bacterium]|nr:HAMP domain-containing protein [Chloroflexota bacterium]